MDGVRSVQRALQLMRIMNEKPAWTLHDLHMRLGLAKSTIHRLLATMQAEGFASQNPVQPGLYQLTREASQLSCGITEKSLLAECSRPFLHAATLNMKWPLSLAVVEGLHMRVVACSMPHSPYAIRSSSLGHTYDMVESALGRAYISYCSPAERRILIEGGMKAGGNDLHWADMRALRKMILETRRQRCAVRAPANNAETAAFAVPVFGNGMIQGSLVYSTYARQYDDKTIDRFLPLVQETATLIGKAVQRAAIDARLVLGASSENESRIEAP